MSAAAIQLLWALGVLAELIVAVRLLWLPGWRLGALGLALNGAKSLVLMAVWYGWGFAAYSACWRSTRWVHWVALAILLLQALTAMARIYPRGRRFAAAVGVAVVGVGVGLAVLQSGWVTWRGAVGAATDLGRAVGVVGIAVAGGTYLLYDRLGMTSNARAWSLGLLTWLGGTTVFALAMALWPMGPMHVAAQVANQSALLVAVQQWWEMGFGGDEYQFDAGDSGNWSTVTRWIGTQKGKARHAAGLYRDIERIG